MSKRNRHIARREHPYDERHDRDADDRGHENATDFIGKLLDGGFGRSRFVDHANDARKRRVIAHAVDAHGEPSRFRNSRANHAIARLLFHGNTFARKCRFVHRGRTLDNRTVERHCLARAHHEHISDLHLFKGHLNLGFALAPRCNLRRKVEKRRNRISRFALRACLEIFAQRDERQNHAGRFEIQVHHGHMRRVDVARSHSNANAINGCNAVHSRCRGAKRDERIHVGGAMHKAFETAAEIFEVHRDNGNEQQELRECKRNHVLVAQEARRKRPREHVAHRKIEQRNGEHERND